MRVPVIVLCGLTLAANACAGNVKTSYLKKDRLQSEQEIKGVITYRPMLAKLTHTLTTHVDKNGKVPSGSCRPVIQKEELVTVADLDHPMRIRNASGIFSAAKFSVTMSNGLLTGVNAEPTQKFSDILTAASGVLEAVDGIRAAGVSAGDQDMLACNASPIMTFKPLR